jgi:hypothetical protein
VNLCHRYIYIKISTHLYLSPSAPRCVEPDIVLGSKHFGAWLGLADVHMHARASVGRGGRGRSLQIQVRAGLLKKTKIHGRDSLIAITKLFQTETFNANSKMRVESGRALTAKTLQLTYPSAYIQYSKSSTCDCTKDAIYEIPFETRRRGHTISK